MYDSYDDYIKKNNKDIAQNIKTAARLQGITEEQTVLLLISKAQYLSNGCSVYLRGAIKFVSKHVKTIESEQLNIIKMSGYISMYTALAICIYWLNINGISCACNH